MQQIISKTGPFLVLFLFILLTGCGGGDDSPGPGPDPDPDPVRRTVEDVINDFENLEINVGTNDLEL